MEQKVYVIVRSTGRNNMNVFLICEADGVAPKSFGIANKSDPLFGAEHAVHQVVGEGVGPTNRLGWQLPAIRDGAHSGWCRPSRTPRFFIIRLHSIPPSAPCWARLFPPLRGVAACEGKRCIGKETKRLPFIFLTYAVFIRPNP